MNAQEMLLNYAAQQNNGKLTNQDWLGKAIVEGVRGKDRPNGDIVTIRIRREGREIIVSETVTSETVAGKTKTTSEVLRVSL